MTSPTQRTNTWLKDRGWLSAIVEKWNPHVKRRQDLWGFADVLAVMPMRGIVAIQTTTGDHVAERKAKIEAEPRAKMVLLSGVQVWVIGWRLIGERGKRKLWTARIEVARVVDERIVWSEHEETAKAGECEK